MQPVPDTEQQTITQVFTTFLSLVGKDVQAWVDLIAEDAVIEFLYASSTLGRLEGKEAIYNYLRGLQRIQTLWFSVRTNIHDAPRITNTRPRANVREKSRG